MYLTVGEISKALGISTEANCYYVKEGIITPKRNEENNYWVYSSEDLMKLTGIMFYRSMGLTMKDIKDIMSRNKRKSGRASFFDELGRRVQKRTASSWKISDWLYAGGVQKTGMF